jgi:magnesium-transporting ATPase (P-type)
MSQASNIGLSAAEAAARLKSDGYNELPQAQRRGALRILFEVLRQPMFTLLIAGGIVYLLLGDRMEAMLLLAFASLSVVITLVQESRSERVLEALRNLASPRALVIRDGSRIQIASLVLINMGLILVNRSFESSPVRAILRPNRALWTLLGGVLALLGLAVFWQPAQALFHFGPLHWDNLGACAAVGVASLIVLEALISTWFHGANLG